MRHADDSALDAAEEEGQEEVSRWRAVATIQGGTLFVKTWVVVVVAVCLFLVAAK